jgi:transcriptional regulator with XRE-family HTH domain
MRLRENGVPQRDIATALGVSQGTVSNWARKYRNVSREPLVVAAKIRAELVCCDIYQRMEACDAGDDEWMALKQSPDYHAICFYGEWAARIAEQVV